MYYVQLIEDSGVFWGCKFELRGDMTKKYPAKRSDQAAFPEGSIKMAAFWVRGINLATAENDCWAYLKWEPGLEARDVAPARLKQEDASPQLEPKQFQREGIDGGETGDLPPVQPNQDSMMARPNLSTSRYNKIPLSGKKWTNRPQSRSDPMSLASSRPLAHQSVEKKSI